MEALVPASVEEHGRTAVFDEKVKVYIFLYVLFVLVTSIVGLVVVPFWVLGLGQYVSRRFFNTLHLQLTDKHLLFAKGMIFTVEKTIPLENIQDIAFVGGPVLRSFGLTQINVETAGGGGAHRQGEMSMIGVVDAAAFKAAILEQRERLVQAKHRQLAPSPSTTTTTTTTEETTQLLRDIKAELVAIKQALQPKT